MKIPDRWLDYSAVGGIVPGTSFVPFKVPLYHRYCERLPENDRHTTRDVIKAIPQLGLVINLTNTQYDTKYYHPNDWLRNGIEYKWLKTEGHVTPSQHLLVQFCKIVQRFLRRNPEKLIGVHCTHGVNRTGFFICAYIVLCNNLSPSDVLRNFHAARGYPIERHNYIASVIQYRSNNELKQTIWRIGQSRWSDKSDETTAHHSVWRNRNR